MSLKQNMNGKKRQINDKNMNYAEIQYSDWKNHKRWEIIYTYLMVTKNIDSKNWKRKRKNVSTINRKNHMRQTHM